MNCKGYNSLTVGNHNDDATAMAGDTVFRNPASKHGDRESPEISANGTGVTTNGLTGSGTSFSSPAVAGVAALIQERDRTLCSWPEGCRAILLASAYRNPDWKNWLASIIDGHDAKDGSGALDAYNAIRIAGQRRTREAQATRYGWDVGTLGSDDFDKNRILRFQYNVLAPRTLLSPKVKIALAWSSGIHIGTIPKTGAFESIFKSLPTVDLDLLVHDSHGQLVAGSSTFDNNYEIAEFNAVVGEPYQVTIRRWNGEESVRFGLAWAVNGTERWLVEVGTTTDITLPGR